MSLAPLCECGHRASEHTKVANVRAQCQWWPRHVDEQCPCAVYRPREEEEEQ